jgi:hypothetical protein
VPYRRRLTAALIASALITIVPASAHAAIDRYTKDITQGNQNSAHADINETGDEVAYVTSSTNIIPNVPGTPQVLVSHLPSGDTHLASVSSAGEPAANPAADLGIPNAFDADLNPLTALVSGPSMSVTGTAVAFTSTAINLVAGDTNGVADVFVHDRLPNQTELVSVAADGGPANGPSWGASFGYQSRFVAFVSTASNLVKGDDNGHADAFLRDLATGKTQLVSSSDTCKEANADVTDVSVAEGRYVAFSTTASNLVARDTNGASDVFIKKLPTPRAKCGDTKRASVASDGGQANGSSQNASLGGNGKYISFASTANNLVGGDNNHVQDIFWRIMGGTAAWAKKPIQGPKTLRVSVGHLNGTEANGPSFNPEMTVAGRFVYFDSAATNLFPKEDTDSTRDIYHNDIKTGFTTLSSRRDGRPCQSGAFECTGGAPTGGVEPSVSYHGTQVVYLSLGKQMRDEGALVGTPGIVDVLLRHIGNESAPPPSDIRR